MKEEILMEFHLLYLIQKCYTVLRRRIIVKRRRKSKLHFTPLLKNWQTNYNLSKCFEMENCNDFFWYAKKLTGKFLHLHDSLNIYAYIHIYIHVILKSSGIKSEYSCNSCACLRLNRVGRAVKVCRAEWGSGVGHSFTNF